MNDLAYIRPRDPNSNRTGILASPDDGQDNKPQFPTLRFNGPQAEAAKLTGVVFGEEYDITIRIRAKRIGGEDYETRGEPGNAPMVEFEVISSEDPIERESEEEQAKEAAKPVLAEAKAKSKTKTPSPKETGLIDEED